MRLFLFTSVASFLLVPSMRAQSASQTSNTAGPAQSTVFFSGEVLLEDGSAPPTNVIVQQICSGTARESVVTDAQGHFTLKVDGAGDKNTADASQSSGPPPDLSKPMGNSSIYSQPVTSSLRDCELQAVLAGFRSDRAGMAIKSTLDNVHVGTIILHPLTRAAAATISATSLEAPARSRKAYEKGMMAAKAQKWDAAVNEFTAATTAYPKFAAAWYELGIAHQNRNELPEADAAFKEALKSDPKYVKPYQSLTASSYKQEQWVDLDNYSTQWIQLDPDDFPAAYLFSAFAKAKRGKVDEAEQAARQGIRIDKDHSVPKLNYVLGILLMQKRAFAESAQCFRAYLQQAPNSNEAVIVRDQLPKLEAAAGVKPVQP